MACRMICRGQGSFTCAKFSSANIYLRRRAPREASVAPIRASSTRRDPACPRKIPPLLSIHAPNLERPIPQRRLVFSHIDEQMPRSHLLLRGRASRGGLIHPSNLTPHIPPSLTSGTIPFGPVHRVDVQLLVLGREEPRGRWWCFGNLSDPTGTVASIFFFFSIKRRPKSKPSVQLRVLTRNRLRGGKSRPQDPPRSTEGWSARWNHFRMLSFEWPW